MYKFIHNSDRQTDSVVRKRGGSGSLKTNNYRNTENSGDFFIYPLYVEKASQVDSVNRTVGRDRETETDRELMSIKIPMPL